jgi:dTMP kinase
VAPATELLLYSADRAQHLIEMIGPALGRGAVVLCDRYLDATLAYQGYGRMLGTDAVLAVHRIPPLDRRPDRTVLLDLDPAEGLARARSRNVSRGTDRCEGRYEMEEIEFHGRVRRGYLDLAAADPERIRVVQAAGSEDEVAARVRAALADLLPEIDGGAP